MLLVPAGCPEFGRKGFTWQQYLATRPRPVLPVIADAEVWQLPAAEHSNVVLYTVQEWHPKCSVKVSTG